jgi:uncharacterized protein DUF2612
MDAAALETTIQSEYANSPTLMRLIQNVNSYLDPRANIDAFYDLIFNIDTAVGYGLDVWGRIVGVGRVLNLAIGGPYFGFTGPSGASGAPWNQGIFYDGEALTTNYALSDTAFRVLILAKALFNITNATIAAINQILINLFGPDGLIPVGTSAPYVTDGLNMTMSYVFSATPDPVATAIIYQSGVLPRPCGVLANVTLPSPGPLTDEAGNVLKDDAGNTLFGSTVT